MDIKADNLYIGPGIRPDLPKILERLQRELPCPEVFVITFAAAPSDQLEFLRGDVFFYKKMRIDPLPVVGLALGKAEAFELVRRMAEEVYRETKTADIKSYLIKKGF